MSSSEQLAEQLYEIASIPDFDNSIKLYDKDGKGIYSPKDARWFYITPNDILIRIPQTKKYTEEYEVLMYLNKTSNIKESTLLDMIKRMRLISNVFGLKFTTKLFSRTSPQQKFLDISRKDKSEMSEGFDKVLNNWMLMEAMIPKSRKRSLWELENAKLTVIHTIPITEETHGARSRNIEEIYIQQGKERFKMPCNYLMIAKAMTRHLNESGTLNDTIGRHLYDVAEEYFKVKKFLGGNRDKTFLRELCKKRLKQIREQCNSLTNKKVYTTFKESFQQDNTPSINNYVQPIKDVYGLTDDDMIRHLASYIQDYNKPLVDCMGKLGIECSNNVYEIKITVSSTPVKTAGQFLSIEPEWLKTAIGSTFNTDNLPVINNLINDYCPCE